MNEILCALPPPRCLHITRYPALHQHELHFNYNIFEILLNNDTIHSTPSTPPNRHQECPVFHPQDVPCISGCQFAIRHYWLRQRPILSDILANYAAKPQLIWSYDDGDDGANHNKQQQQQQLHNTDNIELNKDGWRSDGGSGGESHITLKWLMSNNNRTLSINLTKDNGDNSSSDWYSLLLLLLLQERPFRIEYQYATMEERMDGEGWWTLAEYHCQDQFECEIGGGLIPFTKYRVSKLWQAQDMMS